MSAPNREQAELWNDDIQAGHWVDQQVRYDQMLAPFVDLLLDGARVGHEDRVLDVGCGCGATTIAAARVAAAGSAHGVDLSAPMLQQARDDADAAGVENVTFEQADAQTHPFAPASFDAVISRFGIMFFDDPIAAFANLHRASRPGARLAFVCWQPRDENEWLLVPGAALAEHVPLPDPPPPGAPGMFAFADPARTRRILGQAGWHDVDAADTRMPILVGGRGTVDDAVAFLRMGSTGRTVLGGVDADTEARALASVRAAVEPYHDGDGVSLGAAIWLVTARA